MECRRVLVGTTLREPPDAGHAGQRWTMNGSSFGALAYADTRVVWRDPLLKWVLLLPIGLALLLRVADSQGAGGSSCVRRIRSCTRTTRS